MPEDLRVAVDVTPLAGDRSGIGIFAAALVAGLAAAPGIEPVGLAMTAAGRTEIRGALPAAVALSRPAPARVLRALWARSNQPTVGLLAGPVDVVHGTNYVVPPGGSAAELVSVHDLSPWRTPDAVAPSSRAYPLLVERALARGAHVHAISAFVAAEIVADLGVPEERVHVVHLAADELPAGASERGRLLAGTDRFVLAIGSEEPRKDFPGLVRAVAEVGSLEPDMRLVIAGGSGEGSAGLTEAVAASGMADRVVRLGYVSDQQKADLLAAAAVVASTSTYEGFGIVPVEAMAAGVPVVAVAGGSIPEVCGDAAELVPVGDPEAMAAGLARLLGDNDLRAERIARGHRQVERFSWASTVGGLTAVYRQLAAS